MVSVPRSLSLALLLAGCLHAPLAAQTQKITLQLKDVTALEAMEALSKEAVVPITIGFGPLEALRMDPNFAKLEVRSSFEWKEVPFSRALKELCAKYGLAVMQRWQGAYRLHFAQFAPPAPKPEKLVGLAEKQGVKIWATGVSISSNRSINFGGGPGVPDQNANTNLTLQLNCSAAEETMAKIAGIENVTAKDDRGAVLVSGEGWRGHRGFGGGGVSMDIWSGMASMSGPHPKATRLAWVEGDVMVYRTYRPFQLELPIPESGKGGRKQTPDATVELTELVPEGAQGGNPNGERGPLLKVRVYLPNAAGTTFQDGGGNGAPFLVGKSGKLYASTGGGSGGRGDEQGTQYDIECHFPPIDEPVVKAVFSLVVQRDPQPLLRFRMENIPLPAEGGFIPTPMPLRRPNPLRPAAPAPTPEPEMGGATLVSQVRIGSTPAGEGTLSLGLARKTNDGWGTIRWQDVEVGKDGTARLEGVQPGSYRLLRIYRPKEGSKNAGPGGWVNVETTIQVTTAKEVTTPPLEWSLEPATKPKPAQKAAPAARKAPKGKGR